MNYGEPMPCEQLVSFGVSFLYMGWDKHYGYQLYQSDRSGNYGGWKATCIGNNSGAAVFILKQELNEDLIELGNAQDLTVKVLSKTLDMTKLTSKKVEMATLTRENRKTVIKILSNADAGALIVKYEKNEAEIEVAKREKLTQNS